MVFTNLKNLEKKGKKTGWKYPHSCFMKLVRRSTGHLSNAESTSTIIMILKSKSNKQQQRGILMIRKLKTSQAKNEK